MSHTMQYAMGFFIVTIFIGLSEAKTCPCNEFFAKVTLDMIADYQVNITTLKSDNCEQAKAVADWERWVMEKVLKFDFDKMEGDASSPDVPCSPEVDARVVKGLEARVDLASQVCSNGAKSCETTACDGSFLCDQAEFGCVDTELKDKETGELKRAQGCVLLGK